MVSVNGAGVNRGPFRAEVGKYRLCLKQVYDYHHCITLCMTAYCKIFALLYVCSADGCKNQGIAIYIEADYSLFFEALYLLTFIDGTRVGWTNCSIMLYVGWLLGEPVFLHKSSFFLFKLRPTITAMTFMGSF